MSTPTHSLGPGLHYNIPAPVYHADPCARPSLSSGIARTILAKSLAHAKAEHPRLGGSEKKSATESMDTGSIVHALVGGRSSDELDVRDYPTFRSKAAQEWEAASRAAGKTPVLACDLDPALGIVSALQSKAAVGLTDNPFTAPREVTAVWHDDGALYRARFDALIAPTDGPWTIWDWKVTGDVSISEVKRKFRRFGYHLQAAHYLAAADALCPKFAGRHSFVFVFIEDTPPYSVRRYCLKPDTLGVAAIDIRRAHKLWAEAMRSGQWPDASRAETTFIDVPNFADDDEEGDAISC